MLTAGTGAPTENPGWKRCFAAGHLTLGLWLPIESVWRERPVLTDQERLARRAEELGVAALWFRDIPLRVPSFGDVGSVHDIFVYLSWIAAHTSRIALATGAVALPLRHPLHVAKAAASIDRLSGGRLVLGVASGDRATEFPAFGRETLDVPADFRAALEMMTRSLIESPTARIESLYGVLDGADIVPRPIARGLPLMVAGGAGQSLDWIAAHADGWITWPRALDRQPALVQSWRDAVGRTGHTGKKPLAQALYIDLATDPDLAPWAIHLGYRVGRNRFLELLEDLEAVGIDHVALNLTPGHRPAAEVLEEIGETIVPRFPAGELT